VGQPNYKYFYHKRTKIDTPKSFSFMSNDASNATSTPIRNIIIATTFYAGSLAMSIFTRVFVLANKHRSGSATAARKIHNNNDEQRQQRRAKNVITVVLTGGPCAGKSSSLQSMKDVLTEAGYQILTVPEVPTLLMENGCKFPGIAGPRERLLRYETLLIEMQLQMENTFIDMAALDSSSLVTATDPPTGTDVVATAGLARSHPDRPTAPKASVVICDRGACDVAAYMPPDLWRATLASVGTSQSHLLGRYDIVCHLVTAANGAPAYYTTANNAMRTETPAQAVALCRRTQECWEAHPTLAVFPNEGVTFADKVQRVSAFVVEQCDRIVTNERSL
jgi:predicted ATPase